MAKKKKAPKKSKKKPTKGKKKGASKAAVALLAEAPSAPPGLVQEVDVTLMAFSPLPFTDLEDGYELEGDLWLTAYARRALAGPFQRIADTWKRLPTMMPHVSPSECEDLESVGEARKLVAKEAGYAYP